MIQAGIIGQNKQSFTVIIQSAHGVHVWWKLWQIFERSLIIGGSELRKDLERLVYDVISLHLLRYRSIKFTLGVCFPGIHSSYIIQIKNPASGGTFYYLDGLVSTGKWISLHNIKNNFCYLKKFSNKFYAHRDNPVEKTGSRRSFKHSNRPANAQDSAWQSWVWFLFFLLKRWWILVFGRIHFFENTELPEKNRWKEIKKHDFLKKKRMWIKACGFPKGTQKIGSFSRRLWISLTSRYSLVCRQSASPFTNWASKYAWGILA